MQNDYNFYNALVKSVRNVNFVPSKKSLIQEVYYAAILHLDVIIGKARETRQKTLSHGEILNLVTQHFNFEISRRLDESIPSTCKIFYKKFSSKISKP